MAFWSNPTDNPKRSFRFQVTFDDKVMWYAKKVSRPSYSIQNTEHKYLNHTFNFPGHLTWEEVTMTLVDPGGDNDAASMINKLIQASGYGPPQDDTDVTTIGKAAMVHNIGNVIIRVLDAGAGDPDQEGFGFGDTGAGTGIVSTSSPADAFKVQVMEEWTLRNVVITGVAFSELSYDSDDLTTIDIKMKYDWAECKSMTGIQTLDSGPTFKGP